MRIIASAADISSAIRALKRICPAITEAHSVAGDPPLRRWQDGFPGLTRIVVGQQLSTSSANAIHGRLMAAVTPLDAKTLARTPDETLRACGLSAAKIKTLRALASSVTAGSLDFTALADADAEIVRTQLTAVNGIGPWTADIYLMFCRGDADAFAPGDLALQIGAQKLFRREERLSPAELIDIAERWRPWRAVAARMIWAYYGAIKSAGR